LGKEHNSLAYVICLLRGLGLVSLDSLGMKNWFFFSLHNSWWHQR